MQSGTTFSSTGRLASRRGFSSASRKFAARAGLPCPTELCRRRSTARTFRRRFAASLSGALSAMQWPSNRPCSRQQQVREPRAIRVGNILADSFNNTGTELLAPSYRTPYSMQFNIGVQRELRPGTVLTVDYLRNIGLHSLLGYDTNHVGDARYLNTTAAQNAIAATLKACGVSTIDQAIAACPGLHSANPPTMPSAGPATIFDFAAHGLDSGYGFLGSLEIGRAHV